MQNLQAKTLALFIKHGNNAQESEKLVNAHFDEALRIAQTYGKPTASKIKEIIQLAF